MWPGVLGVPSQAVDLFGDFRLGTPETIGGAYWPDGLIRWYNLAGLVQTETDVKRAEHEGRGGRFERLIAKKIARCRPTRDYDHLEDVAPVMTDQNRPPRLLRARDPKRTTDPAPLFQMRSR